MPVKNGPKSFKMISVFTYKEYLIPSYRKMIFPLLLDLGFIKKGVLLDYYYLVDEIKAADVVIVPIDIKYFYKKNKTRELFSMVDAAKKMNKMVWVYSAGDIGKTLNMDVYTFRFGGFNSILSEKTFILPAFIPDPFENFKNQFTFIEKEKKPKVGFVGHAHNSKRMLLREYLIYLGVQLINKRNEILDYQAFFPTGRKRSEYLKKLKESPEIMTDFILRKKYRGGSKTAEERIKTSAEFFKNLEENPYVFCLRGSGNFSTRFYEALAMGRIPLFLDTDCRLPLSWIQWKNHVVVTSPENFEADLIQFHKSLSNEEFKGIQLDNRKLWLSNLTREGYFVQIHDFFLNKLK